eukprot:342083-Rhodomonas_salina.4
MSETDAANRRKASQRVSRTLRARFSYLGSRPPAPRNPIQETAISVQFVPGMRYNRTASYLGIETLVTIHLRDSDGRSVRDPGHVSEWQVRFSPGLHPELTLQSQYVPEQLPFALAAASHSVLARWHMLALIESVQQPRYPSCDVTVLTVTWGLDNVQGKVEPLAVRYAPMLRQHGARGLVPSLHFRCHFRRPCSP